MARSVIYDNPRFSLVGWLSDVMDLRQRGEPERTVTINGDLEIVHGLAIPTPFGPGTDASLVIHATRGNGTDGGEITVAIAEAMLQTRVEAPPKPRITKASFYPAPPAEGD